MGSNPFTWGQRMLNAVRDRAMLRVSVRVVSPSIGSTIPLFFMFVSSTSSLNPLNCLEVDCPGQAVYKLCVNAASVGACDERVDVPVGRWEVLTLDVHQRMLTKLGSVPPRLTMYMGGYSKGSASEAWVDDLLYFVNDDGACVVVVVGAVDLRLPLLHVCCAG